MNIESKEARNPFTIKKSCIIIYDNGKLNLIITISDM